MSSTRDITETKLDEIDIKLISHLQDNGRISLVKLGKKIGLKHSSVRERLLKIITHGFIKIQANVNLKNFGFRIAFIGFEVIGYENAMKLIEKLRKCPRTLLVGYTSGEFNVIAIMVIENIDLLRDFIERNLRSIINIRRISINFGEIIYPKFLPLAPIKKLSSLSKTDCYSCALFKGR